MKSIRGNLSTVVESEGGARKYRHKHYPLCHGTSCTRGSSVLHGNIPNGINISCSPRTFNCYDIMFFFRERKLIREHQRDDLDRAWLILKETSPLSLIHQPLCRFWFWLRYIFAVRFHMVKKNQVTNNLDCFCDITKSTHTSLELIFSHWCGNESPATLTAM